MGMRILCFVSGVYVGALVMALLALAAKDRGKKAKKIEGRYGL